MKATPHRMVVSGLAIAVTLTGTWSCGPLPSGGGESAAPEYYLWAWRRPEDLGFIDPNRVGAAIWTGTTFINDGKMTTQRRTVPVTYPTGTKVVAVMRLEIDRAYGDDMAVRVAAAVVAVGRPSIRSSIKWTSMREGRSGTSMGDCLLSCASEQAMLACP